MDLLEAENRWRAAGLFYATCFGTMLLIGFAVQNFMTGAPMVAAVALTGLPFMAATLAWSRAKPVMPAWTPYPAVGFTMAMLIYMLHVSNIFDGATLMWFCAVPPTTILALRARTGLIVSMAMFVAMVLGLLYQEHELPDSYAVRLAAAYLFITGLIYAYERNRERTTHELLLAQERISTLEGILRICGWCHRKMRDDAGGWVSTEQFFQDRAPVRFSHGICPDCQLGVQRAVTAPAA